MPTSLDSAATVFRDGTRDDQALALDVPSNGELTALRAVLDRVDREQLAARALTCTPPTSTTCSSPSPGGAAREEPTRELAGTDAKES